MNEITLLSIDLAKNVFELHGVDARQGCVLRRQVRRSQWLSTIARLKPQCVAMEACGGAHHWARSIRELGGEVRLIAPQFVKPFVKGHKTDRNDAEAISEAAQRPGMRFVAVKTIEQQQVLALHRLRSAAIKARTGLANCIRGLASEFGVVVPQGLNRLRKALPEVLDQPNGLPPVLREELRVQLEQLRHWDSEVKRLSTRIEQHLRTDERAGALMGRAGVGPLTASAFAAVIGDAQAFKNGRQVSAHLGLVPRQHSSGGKPKLLGISKRGDAYLRTLLIHGARSVMRTAAEHPEDPVCRWAVQLRQRCGMNKATVALANKMARQLWAQLAYG